MLHSSSSPSQWPGFPASFVAAIKLFSERIAGGAQSELEGLAWNTLHKGPDRPAEAGWNRTSERDGLDLHVEPAVSLLIAPVRIESPKKTVIFGGFQCALAASAGRVDFGNLCASRDAVSVPRIQPPKVDVVGRIQHHRDYVVLPHSHCRHEMITLLREGLRLEDLRGKSLRICIEILHQSLEIRCFGSGGKRSSAPVVQHGSG